MTTPTPEGLLPEPSVLSNPTTEFQQNPSDGGLHLGEGGTLPPVGLLTGQTTSYYSPPAAPSYATASGARPGSNLADMLTAAGMYQLGPDAGSGYDYTTPPPVGGYPSGGSVTSRLYPGSKSELLGDPKLQGDERVYMGHDMVTTFTDPDGPKPDVNQKSAKTMTVAQAANLPYMWYDSPDKLANLQKRMREAGYTLGTSTNDVFGDTVSVWEGLVQQAAAIYDRTGGHTLITPYDLLAQRKKDNIAAGNIDKNGNVVSTSTSRSVNDLTEGQAWATLQQTMSSMLGRDPTDQEVRDFLSAANADAAKDPTRSVTTTKTDAASGESTSHTTTSGGYTSADAAQSAYQDLHDSADYAKYQSGTTYFNAMLSALGEVAGSQ